MGCDMSVASTRITPCLRPRWRRARDCGMTVDSYVCPTCGSEVKVGTKCPGCAPKRKAKPKRAKSAPAPREKKSWEQDEIYDGIDLPLSDEDFDYDDFVAKEFGKSPHNRVGIKPLWWWTAVVLAIVIIGLLVAGLW